MTVGAPDYASWYREPTASEAAARSALVVIDLQVGNCDPTSTQGRWAARSGRVEVFAERYERVRGTVVPALRGLLAHWRSAGRPVVYVVLGGSDERCADVLPSLRRLCRDRCMYEGSRDYEVLAEVAPQAGDLVLRKTTMSAFTSSGLEAALRHGGITSLYLCGVSTDQCVLATAYDAADRGWRCTLVEDCCGATRRDLHEAALGLFSRFGGSVVDGAAAAEAA